MTGGVCRALKTPAAPSHDCAFFFLCGVFLSVVGWWWWWWWWVVVVGTLGSLILRKDPKDFEVDVIKECLLSPLRVVRVFVFVCGYSCERTKILRERERF